MKKPNTMIYGVDDMPPRLVVWLAALQQLGLVATTAILPLVITRAVDASTSVTASVLSLGMIVSGAITMLQAVRSGVIGSGLLVPTTFSGIYLGPSLVAAQTGGLPLVFGMTMFAGVFEVAFSRLAPRLRPFFPPEIAGLVILLLGLLVGSIGLRNLVDPVPSVLTSHVEAIVFGISLCTMIALNIWTRGLSRMFCILIGMAVGYSAAIVTGVINAATLHSIATAPLIALPRLDHLAWAFEGALIIPFAVAGLAAAMNTAANITTLQRANDVDWVRPDLKTIGSGSLVDGIGAVASGAAGTMGVSTLALSVGVIVATGTASRIIAYVIGGLLLVLAFQPTFIVAVIATPPPVIAAALLFLSCFLLIGGVQVIASRMLDGRRTLVIGLAVIASLAVLLYPSIGAHGPLAIQAMLGSSLVTGTLVALFLNGLFRIGVRKRVVLRCPLDASHADRVEGFFREHGAIWGARPEVISRAIFGTNQMLEALTEYGEVSGLAVLTVIFDEFNLDVELRYTGREFELTERRPTDVEVRDSEEGLRRLAGFLVRRNADRVSTKSSNDENVVKFHFDH